MPTEQQPQQQSQQTTTAATKQPSKHGHAASQTQPAPRKVRFNVGSCSIPSIPPFSSRSSGSPHRLSVSGSRCRRRGCLWYRLLCCPSPNRQEGRNQEDCPIRPFNVLSEDSPGVEVTQIPQRGWRMRECRLFTAASTRFSSLIHIDCRSYRF